MKPGTQLILAGLILWLFPSLSLKAQLNFTTAAAVTVDFTNTVVGVNNGAYLGLGLASAPAPGQLDADGISVSGITNTAGASITSDYFIPSPSDALYAVIDGSDNWFAVAPVGSWNVVLQIDNNIPGMSIYSFDISFSIQFRNIDANDQTYKLEYATNIAGPWTQFGNVLSVPSGIPVSNFWGGATFNAGTLCMGEIASGSSVYFRISGAGAATDNIAFDEVTFTPNTSPLCNITNITSFTTANVKDMTLDLNWTVDGSGDCTETFFVVGREGVAPAADLLVNNLQGLYEASNFNANSNWAARTDANEVFAQTLFTLGADNVDYFVYKGSGTSVTISGLDQNTAYNFLILATGGKCSWLVGNNVNSITLLPIDLVDFTGVAREEDILLEWRTQTEANNDYMAVERSSNGVDFFEIGRIPGAGNTQIPQEYRFIDEAPISGTNYYRLKQVDFDGALTYYHIISVNYDANFVAWQLSPTQVSDKLLITTNKAFEVSTLFNIIDLHGRLIRTISAEAGAVRQQINLSGLVSGPYFLQVNRQGLINTKRFIKK